MIVIVEGVDGTGKSTLCRKLADCFNCPVISPPGAYDEDAYFHWCNMIDKCINKLAIVDRSFISDLVYRLTDDREVGTLNLLKMILILQRYDLVKIIHCKNKNAFTNALNRGEDFITNAELHSKISYNYDVIFTMIKKFVNVEVEEFDFDKQTDFDKIVRFIKEV